MVCGDIGEWPPPEPDAEPTEAELEDIRSNGVAESWRTPVDRADDDFDDVSAFRASIADDAAPRARNMAELQQCRARRPIARARSSASAMPLRKTQ
jgi:hypothetical protein